MGLNEKGMIEGSRGGGGTTWLYKYPGGQVYPFPQTCCNINRLTEMYDMFSTPSLFIVIQLASQDNAGITTVINGLKFRVSVGRLV